MAIFLPLPMLLDPTTRVKQTNGTYTATAFPGNQIPISRFNSYTVSMLQIRSRSQFPRCGLAEQFSRAIKNSSRQKPGERENRLGAESEVPMVRQIQLDR